MIWIDNVGLGSGGAQQIGTAGIGGQAFTVYQYGLSVPELARFSHLIWDGHAA